MGELKWTRIVKGAYKNEAYDRRMEAVPHKYTIRRGTSDEGGGWMIYIDGELYGGGSTLNEAKANADRHYCKSIGRTPAKAPEIVSVFKQGDRITSKISGHNATVIRITGAMSAILRFDQDVEYANKHGLPVAKYDSEFDLTDWVK